MIGVQVGDTFRGHAFLMLHVCRRVSTNSKFKSHYRFVAPADTCKDSIRITYPCVEYTLIPHFYKVKLRYAGVYLSAEAVLTSTHNLCFGAKVRKLTTKFY